MSSAEERRIIREKLIPELLADFDDWGAEYQQDRDLGARGEFANLYRKARKLKTIIWDGVDGSGWRESTRTIVKEVVAHGLLLLLDIDRATAEKAAELQPVQPDAQEVTYGGDNYPEHRRLGIGLDDWAELSELADLVQRTGVPSHLEDKGFMLITTGDSTGACWGKCDQNEKDKERHQYAGACFYRIRRRRQP